MTIEINEREANLITIALGQFAWRFDTTNQTVKAREYRKIISKIDDAKAKEGV